MAQARWWSLSLIALLALSCASANKLSQRSERELAAGDLRGAYEHARAAVAKKPANPRARAAFSAAAERLVADHKTRVIAIAAADTVAAAQQVLELVDLRSEIARYGATLPVDMEFGRQETAIRLGAAHILYGRAERELAAKQPKVAWADFRGAAGFASGYRDVGRRIDEAHALALARVAILPMADQAGVPGISRALADRMYAEVAPHVQPDDFHFTQLVDPGQVYGRITVNELDALERGDAIRIGRRLGVDQVVTGRVYGLRAHTDTNNYRQTIFRKIVDRDTSGAKRERYVEQDFHAITREREVSLHYDVEVVGVGDEASLAAYSDGTAAYARVVFTDYQAQGNCSDYCLVPPGLKQTDPDRAEKLQAEWKSTFGNWTLPALLERARKDRSHTRYGSGDRSAFFGDCRERAVWLGELPSENDLAAIALDGVWQPVLGMLKELDAK
jgi:hypothetical protein